MNLAILGSSRDGSNTFKALKLLSPVDNYEIVDLRTLNIHHYNYEHPLEASDDFLALARKMQNAETIIFATPVYWYAMSGHMKVFFDRLTELLYTHKSIGKSLAGKSTYLIATGAEAVLPEGFEVPFKLTSEYFGMNFKGSQYKAY